MSKISTPVVGLIANDKVSGQAKEIFEQMEKSAGKVPKWIRVMANCEDTLVGFFSLFKSVMDDAPTDKLLKWKIAFVVSEMNKCQYCVSVSKAQLKTLGIEEEQLSDIERICDDKECLAIEYAKAVTKEAYKVDDELMLKMKDSFSDQQIVELTSVVGLFSFINRFNDALRVFPDVK